MKFDLKIPWRSKDIETRRTEGAEFYGIRDLWNQHNDGVVRWDNVNATNATITNLTLNGTTSTTNAAGYIIGTIVQIVSAHSNTEVTTTSGTYQSTNTAASITPKANTHKVMVIATGTFEDSNISTCDAYASIFNGTTDLNPGTSGVGLVVMSGGTAVDIVAPICITVLDSPASTSSTTYTVKIRVGAGSGTIKWGHAGTQNITLYEIAA